MQHDTNAASLNLSAFAPPDYRGETLARLNQVASSVSQTFASEGFAPIEPAILQPADMLFDLYGEEIWERSFVIDDVEHGAWCLRPDFTAPVARSHIASATGQARYYYSGPVFRRARDVGDGALQQHQAGVEIMGEQDVIAADVEACTLAKRALHTVGCQDCKIMIGDLALVFGVLDRVPMPERWRARLRRHFRRPDHFSSLLRRYSGQTADPELASRIAFLKGFSVEGAEAMAASLRQKTSDEGTPHIGKRSMQEIADRFRDLAEDAKSHPLPAESLALIEAATTIAASAPDALREFKALASDAKIDLEAQLTLFAKRLDALEEAGLKPEALQFEAVFGRDLAYYDGFVFEMRSAAPNEQTGGQAFPAKALAGGGRYDTLFKALGVNEAMRGVGAALNLEAILGRLQQSNAKGAAS